MPPQPRGFSLKSLYVFTLSLALSSVTQAASWKFIDYSTPQQPNGACMIYVTDDVDKTDMRLEITRAKGGGGPTEVFIRESKRSSGAKTWVATAASAQVYAFAEVANSGAERTFWHVPVNTQLIVDHLLADKQLTVSATGLPKAKKLSFPRSGFAKALNQIQTKCLGGQLLVDSTYEKLFLAQVVVNNDLSGQSLSQSVRLRELYNLGYKNSMAQIANNKRIADIVSRYQPVVTEYDQVTSRIQQLIQTEIPNLQSGIEKQKSDRLLAEKTLKEVTAAIPGLQAAVNRDQAVLDKARAVRAPLEAENNRLVDVLDRMESYLSSAQNRLSQVNADITTTERRLSSARLELSQLRGRISDLEWRLRQAQDELRTARRERDNYDVNGEMRRRVDGNPRVQSLRQNVRQLEQEVAQLERQAAAARSERDRAKSTLDQCQATVGADCSAEQAALASAEGQLNTAVNGVRSGRDRLDDASRELNRLVSQIESEIRQEANRLENRLRQAIDQERDAQYELSQTKSSIRDLEFTTIPNLERDLRDLFSEQRVAENDVVNAESSVRAASRDLESYRTRVGWAQKTQAIRSAAAQLDQSQDRLSDAVRSKALQEQIIANSTTTQRNLEATLLARQNELSQLRAREATLSGQISQYRQERAPFDAEVTRLKGELSVLQNEYKGILS
jgi:chromosome segregation ATPase